MNKTEKEKVKKAVVKYLKFSAPNKELAQEIAAETAQEFESMFADGTDRLSFEQKVELATRSCIRHSYTAYDDLFIEKTIAEEDDPLMEDADLDTRAGEQDEVSEFIRLNRKKR